MGAITVRRLATIIAAIGAVVFAAACGSADEPTPLAFGAFADRLPGESSRCEAIDEPEWWQRWMTERDLEGLSGVFLDSDGAGSSFSHCTLAFPDPYPLAGADGGPAAVQEPVERTWIMSPVANDHHPCPDDDPNRTLVMAPAPEGEPERLTLDDGSTYRLEPDELRFGSTTQCFVETGTWFGPDGETGPYIRSWDLVRYRIELTPKGAES